MAKKEEDFKETLWPPKKVICVGGVVLKEKRVLLIRQAKGTSLEGQWSIPWGVLEVEETPEMGVLREIEEEAGVTARVEGLMGIQNLSWQQGIGIIFLCRHISGQPTSDGGKETDRAGYYSLDEIEAWQETIEPWCAWIVKRVLQGRYKIVELEEDNPYHPLAAFL